MAGHFRDLENWPVVVLARELPEQTAARKNADAHESYLLSTDGLDAGVSTLPEEVVWRRLQADLLNGRAGGGWKSCPTRTTLSSFFSPTS